MHGIVQRSGTLSIDIRGCAVVPRRPRSTVASCFQIIASRGGACVLFPLWLGGFGVATATPSDLGSGLITNS